jgi:hypothetical protein
VTTTIGIEGGKTGSLRPIIVADKLSQGKPKLPIVLLVGYIGTEIMSQDSIDLFYFTISLTVKLLWI